MSFLCAKKNPLTLPILKIVWQSVAKIDKMLANYNAGHFQVISAIHLNTDNLHAHIIANNTDWQTGTRFNLFKSDFFAIREQIDTILKEKFFSSLEIKQ